MKKFMIAAAAASAIATPAFAQESGNFSGPNIGVVAGFDSYKIKLDGDSGSKSGFQYGLTAGYDLNVGGGVVGVEAEIGDSTAKISETNEDYFSKLSADRELYLGLRAGVAVNPTVLVYAKAGYVNSKVKLVAEYDDTRINVSDTLDGYRVGAGVEYAPAAYFGRIEYRYSDFGKYKIDGYDTGLSSSRHQVVATLGTRF